MFAYFNYKVDVNSVTFMDCMTEMVVMNQMVKEKLVFMKDHLKLIEMG